MKEVSVAAIVGLFEDNRCRRCETVFPKEDQRGHQAYHQEMDERHAALGRAHDEAEDRASFLGLGNGYWQRFGPSPSPLELRAHASRYGLDDGFYTVPPIEASRPKVRSKRLTRRNRASIKG